jgi:hypothetical protein
MPTRLLSDQTAPAGNSLNPAHAVCAILLRVLSTNRCSSRGKFADMDCNSCMASQIS